MHRHSRASMHCGIQVIVLNIIKFKWINFDDQYDLNKKHHPDTGHKVWYSGVPIQIEWYVIRNTCLMLSFHFSKKDEYLHPVSYVVYFARTPIEVKEDDEGNDDEEENVQSLDQVDPDWVMEHSKQGSK